MSDVPSSDDAPTPPTPGEEPPAPSDPGPAAPTDSEEPAVDSDPPGPADLLERLRLEPTEHQLGVVTEWLAERGA